MSRQALGRRKRSAVANRLFTQAMLIIPLATILGFGAWIMFFAPSPQQRLLERFRLKAGDRLPFVQVEGARGEDATLGEMAGGAPLLVLVSDEECPVCHAELENVHASRPEAGSDVRLVVLSVSKDELHEKLSRRYPALTVVSDVNGTFRDRLKLPSVPAAIAIGPDRRVREIRFGLQRAPDLRSLVATLQLSASTGAGTPAP